MGGFATAMLLDIFLLFGYNSAEISIYYTHHFVMFYMHHTFKCMMCINPTSTKDFMDLGRGSMVTFVQDNIVRMVNPVTSTLWAICIHGDTKSYSLVLVLITTSFGTVKPQVGLVKDMAHSIIVETLGFLEIPHFWQLAQRWNANRHSHYLACRFLSNYM